jgi:riboflavin synthase
MFTGIVEEPRAIVGVRARSDGGLDLEVDLGALADGVALGDSIAIAGVCLTVAKLAKGVALFELSPETLAKTRLGAAKVGDRMNVERALRAGDRMGGHLVQGHVDGLAAVEEVKKVGEWVELTAALPKDLARYAVAKGSIALDGVSLTIARLEDRADGARVTIALVPHTLERTALAGAKRGDLLHVEVDVIAKYVERLAEAAIGRAADGRARGQGR